MSNFTFLDPWHAPLPRDGGHVVSLCGGGGKTSLMRAMAAAACEKGLPVVATTTTRTEALDWPGLRVLHLDDIGASSAPAPGECVFLHRGIADDGKWLGLEPEEVDGLGGRWPGALVLVEADGAAKLPLTLHRADEPRWPARTSLAVVVMGLGALGEAMGEVLHRHGRLSAPAGVDDEGDPEATVDFDRLHALLTAPGGYLDRVGEGVPPLIALTQLDRCDDSIGLFAWLDRIMNEAGLPLVMLCELSGPEPKIRTACVDDSGTDT